MSVKENHFAELWGDTVPAEVPCPRPTDPEDLVRRVNVALDGRPSERRPSMGQKFRFSIVLAAVLAVLAGAALAVTVHFDVLDAFFQEITIVGGVMQSPYMFPRSVALADELDLDALLVDGCVFTPEQVEDAFEAQMNGKTIKSLICFNPDAK